MCLTLKPQSQFQAAARVRETHSRLESSYSMLSSSLHYGLRADILKKVIRKCLTLKIDFSANFNLTHDFFWAEALSTPQKLENAKMNLQISI